MAKPIDVETYLATLKHKRLAEIKTLRRAILSIAGAGEEIKWNAPSFRWAGVHRATMRLHPGERLELVLHRGAKPDPLPGFTFTDPYKLIAWAAPDRGVIVIRDAADLAERLARITETVRNWVKATA